MRSAAGPRTNRSGPRAPPLPRTPDGCGSRPSRRGRLLAHHGLRLLAQELLDVVGSQAILSGAPRSLPAAKGLDSRPCAGRCPGAAVDVHDARLDVIEESPDFRVVAAEDAGGQAVRGLVCLLERLVERFDLANHHERDEQLVAEEAMAQWQARHHGWSREEPTLRPVAGQDLAADLDRAAVALSLVDRVSELAERPFVDHGAHPVLTTSRVADRELAGLFDELVHEFLGDGAVDVDPAVGAAFLSVEAERGTHHAFRCLVQVR